jgi:hypothetical protein
MQRNPENYLKNSGKSNKIHLSYIREINDQFSGKVLA